MTKEIWQSKVPISRADMKCLRSLVRRESTSEDAPSESLCKLEDTLDSAVELDIIPTTVVALGNQVSVKNMDSGDESVYTLVLPSQADIRENMISILAPLGMALLGRSIGDVIQFDAPGGTRTFRLLRILA